MCAVVKNKFKKILNFYKFGFVQECSKLFVQTINFIILWLFTRGWQLKYKKIYYIIYFLRKI